MIINTKENEYCIKNFIRYVSRDNSGMTPQKFAMKQEFFEP